MWLCGKCGGVVKLEMTFRFQDYSHDRRKLFEKRYHLFRSKMHSDTADDSINRLPKELPQNSFLSSLVSPITPIQKDHYTAIGLVGLETIKTFTFLDKCIPALRKPQRQSESNRQKWSSMALDNGLQNNTL